MKNQKTEGEDQREVLIQYWIEKATESQQCARSEHESGRMAFARRGECTPPRISAL